MELRFLSEKEKRKVVEKLRMQFGICKLPFQIIRTGKERLKFFSAELSPQDISELNQVCCIEGVGLYLAKEVDDKRKNQKLFRLSIEGTQLLGNQATKNIIELKKEQAEDWMAGEDLILSEEEKQNMKLGEKGFKIMRFNGEFLGTGKLTAEKDRIVNYVSKSRRIKR